MKAWPVLLDSTPDYMCRSVQRRSLLGTPVGADLLVSQICRRLRFVTAVSPTILAPHGADDGYRAAMTAACPSAVVVTTTEALAKALSAATFSDVILFLDPRCLPIDEAALGLLRDCFSARQVAHHLVASEPSVGGTKDHLILDGQGQVRNVHRYYEPTNWPFIAGVAASVVPVSGNIMPIELIPASLVELRQQLVSRGMSSRDVLINGWRLRFDQRARPLGGHGTVDVQGEECGRRREARLRRAAGWRSCHRSLPFACWAPSSSTRMCASTRTPSSLVQRSLVRRAMCRPIRWCVRSARSAVSSPPRQRAT